MTRKFNKDWFKLFPWIHYDESEDRAFCHTCILAYNKGHMKAASHSMESTFISSGYTNWKDALVKKRGFAMHEQSNCHKNAVSSIIALPQTTKDIGELLSEKHVEGKTMARKSLLKILSNIRFLARQAVPLRGDGKGEPNSNFNQLYHLRAEDNPFLKEWLKRKGDNYLGHDMQNEMMKVMALKVLREIASEIQSAEFFAIMVDESSDSANKEQLVLCIRWIEDDLTAREEFIGLHLLDETNATAIVSVIKDVLIRMNITLSKCRSQCYDGCSTMKGEKNGVAKQIKEVEKKALYTHCYTHSLNLAVGDSVKGSKIMKEALEITHEITKLIKKSPKRDSKLENIKRESKIESSLEENIETITLLCPTRWTVRAKCLGSILSNYSYLRELWEWSICNCSDTEMKARIRGVHSYMQTFDYVFGVCLGELILIHSDNLSKTLQSPAVSAVQGQDCASKVVAVLQKLRNDTNFQYFWQNVNSKSKSLGVDDPILPRKRAPPKKLEDFFGYGTAESDHPEKPEDLYRKHYFEALDLVINCIKERFDQEDFKLYAMLQEIILKAAKKENFDEEFNKAMEIYHEDFDLPLLKSQLELFGNDMPAVTDLNFSDVVRYLKSLHSGMKQLLSQVFRLAKLILVCPATNAVSERSFSAMRRAKNYLQSTMNQVRLNHIMLLHVHKDRTDALDLIEIANQFVDGSDHRMTIFGTFKDTDFRNSSTLVESKSTQVFFAK